MGTTAIFRTVVDSAITAAAGGTVADVGKAAAKGFAAGAIAGLVGDLIGGVEVSGDENYSTITMPAEEVKLEDRMSLEEIDEFLANMNGETDAMYDEYFPQEAAGSMDFLLKQAQVGPEYAEKMKQILSANTEITDTAIIQKASDYGSSNGVLSVSYTHLRAHET